MQRERAEKIQCEIYTIRNLVNLLCNHFECKRYNNQIEDCKGNISKTKIIEIINSK